MARRTTPMHDPAKPPADLTCQLLARKPAKDQRPLSSGAEVVRETHMNLWCTSSTASVECQSLVMVGIYSKSPTEILQASPSPMPPIPPMPPMSIAVEDTVAMLDMVLLGISIELAMLATSIEVVIDISIPATSIDDKRGECRRGSGVDDPGQSERL